MRLVVFWQDALSRLAARDCIESVLLLRHPFVERFASAVNSVDERQRRGLREAPSVTRWWWSAAPPPPARAPDLGSATASGVAAEVWRQATAAGLLPFDNVTFDGAGMDGILGRLRFQVVLTEPVVVRPWIDVVMVPVERAYHQLLGAQPPVMFTATVSVLAGRMREVGVHLPLHRGPGAVKDAVARHIGSFFDVLRRTTPELVIDDLLRQRRFTGGIRSEWRLPLALLCYGRQHEARQVLDGLIAAAASRRPFGRVRHELQWLSRRLPEITA
ncbi:hypothetical protein [Micromonospora sp. NPDC047134]|uniref:hypothetical protein n=1 Tax=Micromonospora sp. NPDC047134 TaxID=3154340 RepID=UPI0033D8B0E6